MFNSVKYVRSTHSVEMMMIINRQKGHLEKESKEKKQRKKKGSVLHYLTGRGCQCEMAVRNRPSLNLKQGKGLKLYSNDANNDAWIPSSRNNFEFKQGSAVPLSGTRLHIHITVSSIEHA